MKKIFFIFALLLILIPFNIDALAVWKVDGVKIEPTIADFKESINVELSIRGEINIFGNPTGAGFTQICPWEKSCIKVSLDFKSLNEGWVVTHTNPNECCVEAAGSLITDPFLGPKWCAGSNFIVCDYNFSGFFESEQNLELSVYGSGSGGNLPSTVIGNVKVIKGPEKPNPIDKNKINPLRAIKIEELIDRASGSVYWIATGILVLVILVAGINILIAAGDPSKIQQGKNALFYALIGFALMVMSKGIIDLIRLVIGVQKK